MRVANPLIKCWGCACIWKIAGCFCPERLSSENTTWLGKDSEGTGGGRRQKEGEWQQKKTPPDSALIAALQHIHRSTYTPESMLHTQRNVGTRLLGVKTRFTIYMAPIDVSVSISLNHRTLPRVQISAARPLSSLLIHNNLPQSGSAGGANMTPWPVWARVERGPLILLKDRPTLHVLPLLREASRQTAATSTETGGNSAVLSAEKRQINYVFWLLQLHCSTA